MQDFIPGIRHAKVQLRDKSQADVEYVVGVNWRCVNALAAKAVRNKAKRATSGPITVRVVAVNKVTP